MVSTGKAKSAIKPTYAKYGVIAVVALVLCGVSFGAGINYQKGKQTTNSTASANTNGQFPSQGGGQGGFRGGQRPNIGEVTAVASDSITVQDSRSSSSQTFKITSSTTVQEDGSAASVSDIKTGDTVLVVADSSDSSTAAQIMLNPSFGPPGGGSTQSSPSSQPEQETDSI